MTIQQSFGVAYMLNSDIRLYLPSVRMGCGLSKFSQNWWYSQIVACQINSTWFQVGWQGSVWTVWNWSCGRNLFLQDTLSPTHTCELTPRYQPHWQLHLQNLLLHCCQSQISCRTNLPSAKGLFTYSLDGGDQHMPNTAPPPPRE